MPNADHNSKIIYDEITSFVKKNKNAIAFKSLGSLKYLSCLKLCNVVLGNSSSGLIEVPAFHKPTVNIGNRQKGRLKASSVIDCSEDYKEISYAIEQALSEDFQKSLTQIHNFYEKKATSKIIKDTLKVFSLDRILEKGFYDLKH